MTDGIHVLVIVLGPQGSGTPAHVANAVTAMRELGYRTTGFRGNVFSRMDDELNEIRRILRKAHIFEEPIE